MKIKQWRSLNFFSEKNDVTKSVPLSQADLSKHHGGHWQIGTVDTLAQLAQLFDAKF